MPCLSTPPAVNLIVRWAPPCWPSQVSVTHAPSLGLTLLTPPLVQQAHRSLDAAHSLSHPSKESCTSLLTGVTLPTRRYQHSLPSPSAGAAQPRGGPGVLAPSQLRASSPRDHPCLASPLIGEEAGEARQVLSELYEKSPGTDFASTCGARSCFPGPSRAPAARLGLGGAQR